MGIRTAKQYRDGLRDGRRVIYRGATVNDVVSHSEFIPAIDHSALCYEIVDYYPDMAVADDGDGSYSAFYKVPRSIEDLVARGQLLETVSHMGAGTIVLKEVGSDALFALLRATEGVGRERASAYYEHVRANDLAVAVAQTDAKGNRSLAPSQQEDPDLYVRVVDEDESSIVVRGAKCHTSFSANADEIIVLPTRAMGAEDASWSVSFAIPVDTPGLSLYVSPYLSGKRNRFEFPVSSDRKLLESLTVFDDVVVPKERVFLDRRPEGAGPLALAFVDYHRYTAINYKLPLVDMMVGAGHLVAEANGIIGASHVRDKLTRLIAWAETVRGMSQLAAIRSEPTQDGIQQPEPLAVNMAKYAFAEGFHQATADLMDLAGGLLVTGPGGEDWEADDVRSVLEKYYAAAVPAEERLRLLNFVSELTARDYGGYQAVLATHAEGSLEAEKLQIQRSYDPEPAREYVRRLAHLT